jgi:hypothetical protein
MVGRTCYFSGRRILLIELLVLVICVVVALVIAASEFFATGHFFDIADVLHHETVELAMLVFGATFLTTALLFEYQHRSQNVYHAWQPMAVGAPAYHGPAAAYPQPLAHASAYQSFESPASYLPSPAVAPEQRRRY